MSRPLVIDIVDGKKAPHIQFKAGNGRILTDSEPYEGGVDKAEHAVDVIVEKIQRGEFVLKRNGKPIA